MPPSTHAVKRALRGVMVGRKNHYGLRTSALFEDLLRLARPEAGSLNTESHAFSRRRRGRLLSDVEADDRAHLCRSIWGPACRLPRRR
jgi:hypothetical protein